MKTMPTFENDRALAMRPQVIPACENGLVVFLEGYLDMYGVPFFNQQMARIKENGFTTIVYECSNLSYISSTGVACFIEMLKYARQNHGDVVFAALQPAVFHVFELLGFTTFFPIAARLADAIDGLGRGAVQVYPKTFSCPVCSRKLHARTAGRFRCPACKVILALDTTGQVLVG